MLLVSITQHACIPTDAVNAASKRRRDAGNTIQNTLRRLSRFLDQYGISLHILRHSVDALALAGSEVTRMFPAVSVMMVTVFPVVNRIVLIPAINAFPDSLNTAIPSTAVESAKPVAMSM